MTYSKNLAKGLQTLHISYLSLQMSKARIMTLFTSKAKKSTNSITVEVKHAQFDQTNIIDITRLFLVKLMSSLFLTECCSLHWYHMETVTVGGSISSWSNRVTIPPFADIQADYCLRVKRGAWTLSS